MKRSDKCVVVTNPKCSKRKSGGGRRYLLLYNDTGQPYPTLPVYTFSVLFIVEKSRFPSFEPFVRSFCMVKLLQRVGFVTMAYLRGHETF